MAVVEKNQCTDWYVYLVRTRSNALYCGITTDVQRRYSQHCSGTGAKALKGKGPLQLVWSQKVAPNRSIASKVEYQIKRLTKPQKEQLVSGKTQLKNVIDVPLME
ncbi:GIY-YIG nuclease family protein [Vibrio atypicus]|uniref:GIY-YIG nuclease family protein n=1 Tax=Vibrio atypicus TaxID=558271 RepID=UPI00135A2D14|nr:GIY-YIG nuclease family protein [Vibrio atypicus]